MKGACLVLTLTAVAAAADVNVAEIVRKSVEASDRNWKEAPNYVFTERDLEEKLDSRGHVKSRTYNTYEVMVIEGSEYRKLVKRNDKPLSPEELKAEDEKLAAERARRQHEGASERQKRISKYEKEREQDHAMMREMADAFDYKMAGEETIDGHRCYILDATPRPGYVPKARDTKVLVAMKGRMWVDQKTSQWVKVEAEVMHPVSFYAVASVGPGTKFQLHQAPVGDGVWLPVHFAVRVNASVFFLSRNSLDDETYSNYRRVSGESARSKGVTPQVARGSR